jgi:hypothetical protein
MGEEFVKNSMQYAPVFILSILSLGFVFSSWIPDFSNSWLLQSLPGKIPHSENHLLLSIVSVILAIGGLIAAFLLLKNRKDILPGSDLVESGFAVDASLNNLSRGLLIASTKSAQWIEIRVIERLISFLTYSFVFLAMIARLLDQFVIDGAVRTVAFASGRIGDLTRNFQSGNLRTYLFWALVFLLMCLYFLLGL